MQRGDEVIERGFVAVVDWDGEPQPLEGQALQWLPPARIDPAILIPADGPILQALLATGQFPLPQADTDPLL